MISTTVAGTANSQRAALSSRDVAYEIDVVSRRVGLVQLWAGTAGKFQTIGRVCVGALLACIFVMLTGCTDNEVKAIDRLANGPAERQMREKVLASMAANQSKLLDSFRSTCATYDSQPNEIKKSEVFRGSASIYREVGQIKDWSGILRGISTDQGGSTATLRIHMGSSTLWDKEVRIGSAVYKAVAELSEDQAVVFSGRMLRDYNLSERGKVCNPDFLITLTSIRKLD
jgi:hypothetical protein